MLEVVECTIIRMELLLIPRLFKLPVPIRYSLTEAFVLPIRL